jgi:hypothetical protein
MKKISKLTKNIRKLAENKFIIFFVLLVILAISFGVRLYKITNPVADWHSWRQADTASVTRTFVDEGIDLLHPKYHDISKIQTGYFNPDGYRYVEVPIFNFVHAVAYEMAPQIGFDIWGRLISVFSAVLTTFFLFGIGKKLFNSYIGLISAFFYATLPFNVYFTRVILPDPMSVMFGVGAVYMFALFVDSKKTYQLLASSIMLSLGVLVKPHAIFFGLTIRGIAHFKWSFNGNGIRFRPSFWRWLFAERIGKLMLGFWGVLPFGIGVVVGKKINILHAFLLGAFLYLSVFASANVMHDYYQVFVVPAVALGLGVGVHFIWTNKSLHHVFSKLALFFVVGLMFMFSFYEVRDNYRINDTGILIAGEAADELLPKDAIVIAPYNGDTTFLYQTKRWGFPAVTGDVTDMIAKGAQYFISVNLGDKDTVEYRQRFTEVAATDGYVIIDLTKPKNEL